MVSDVGFGVMWKDKGMKWKLDGVVGFYSDGRVKHVACGRFNLKAYGFSSYTIFGYENTLSLAAV
jgi:acylphosphatase